MEYKGYNGSVVAEDAAISIIHSGLAAKAAGLVRDTPRRIPLQALSGVDFRAATRLTNGAITFGVGGGAAPDAESNKAASSSKAVSFRHKDNEAFQQLYEWLMTVVEHNKANNVDPMAVEFDALAPSRMERASSRLEERKASAEARLEERKASAEARLEEQRKTTEERAAKRREEQRRAAEDAKAEQLARERAATAAVADTQPEWGAAEQAEAAMLEARTENVEKEVSEDDDPYEALARIAKLRDTGILTEEEFAAMKERILASL